MEGFPNRSKYLHSQAKPEHLPYVEQGFIVVAYEIDGYVPDPESASNAEYLKALGQSHPGNFVMCFTEMYEYDIQFLPI